MWSPMGSVVFTTGHSIRWLGASSLHACSSPWFSTCSAYSRIQSSATSTLSPCFSIRERMGSPCFSGTISSNFCRWLRFTLGWSLSRRCLGSTANFPRTLESTETHRAAVKSWNSLSGTLCTTSWSRVLILCRSSTVF
ncbi:hypothetical protein DM02DRAFT_438254 [Periconia macrospinosa]|uniref:Uncharacterized protein n=1 Tax=Periconia macrospinosa TaxID=97972 RepID=A0A2V1DMH8_9PLEO|nr:hypothetical protein DM02DRAFT_438254 [Periconia macrospinosa]